MGKQTFTHLFFLKHLFINHSLSVFDYFGTQSSNAVGHLLAIFFKNDYIFLFSFFFLPFFLRLGQRWGSRTKKTENMVKEYLIYRIIFLKNKGVVPTWCAYIQQE